MMQSHREQAVWLTNVRCLLQQCLVSRGRQHLDGWRLQIADTALMWLLLAACVLSIMLHTATVSYLANTQCGNEKGVEMTIIQLSLSNVTISPWPSPGPGWRRAMSWVRPLTHRMLEEISQPGKPHAHVKCVVSCWHQKCRPMQVLVQTEGKC